jgi:Sec-independent protein translocase protein TatA
MIMSWIGWKIIGGFAQSAWGWALRQWKLILIVVVLLLLLWAGMKIADAFRERAALIEGQKMTLTRMAVDLNMALIEKQSAQQTLDHMIAEKIRVEELAKSLVAEQIVIRAEVEAQKALFDKHDFAAIVKAKPGIIENKANAATQERFDEIEATFN